MLGGFVDYYGVKTLPNPHMVVELNRELGTKFELLNFGGGIGIPYKPEQIVIHFA